MQPITLQKYRTRAQNFYRTHCGEEDPSSAQICAALLAQCEAYRPNSFSTLKSALVADQLERGHSSAAAAIRELNNPVTAIASQLLRKPKTRQVRKVTFEEFKTLSNHLHTGVYRDEAAALVLAYFLGARPCEMRTITVDGNRVSIVGGKKSAPLHRGADRTLVIKSSKRLALVEWAARKMQDCPRTNTAIRDRLRKECRALWPRRKQHPTLKSFRHQLGSNLKASGESDEAIAYIMGHQSTDSISVYGNRRSGAGAKLYIKADANADLSKVRQPKQRNVILVGREKVIGRIEIPPRLSTGPMIYHLGQASGAS